MKLGKVEKTTLGYSLLKVYGKFVHDFFFYKKVISIGSENIPKDCPVLIAPNHQNALMDALAVIYAQDGQPIFLARSDIFKNPIIAKMLYAIKILPVFRLRDGKDKMKLNDVVYAKTVEVLEHNMRVVIFPEAQHINKKHLRKLKKGIQRIAFMLEEKNNFEAGVKIVPAGIFYSNYWNFRSEVLVKFGEPIEIKEYVEAYKKDPVKTLIHFSEVLHEKIKEQIIHIENLENHDEYDLLRDICDDILLKELSLQKNEENTFKAYQEVIKRLDIIKEEDSDGFSKLMKLTRDYAGKLKELRIKDWLNETSRKEFKPVFKAIILVLGFPIFFYGYINNIIVYKLPSLITKNLKDKQFESSISYGFGIFLFPFVYLIQFALVWIFTKIWYVALIYFVTTPVLGLLSFLYHRLFVKFSAFNRYNNKKNKSAKDSLLSLREEVRTLFNSIKK